MHPKALLALGVGLLLVGSILAGIRTNTSRLGHAGGLAALGPGTGDVSAAPWTPLDLGSALVAWYDAGDAATITESGGAVSQWNDKSGNTNHLAQGTGANQPVYSATGFQSNAPGITFTTNDFLSKASMTIGTNKTSAFIHAQFKTGASLNLLGYQASGDAGPFSANSVILAETNGAGTSLDSYWKGAAKSTVPLPGGAGGPWPQLVSTGYYRMATVFDSANHTFYLDNAYTATPVAVTTSITAPGTILLGARADAGQGWTGAVREVILMNRDATSDERAKIDSYFLRPWTRVLITEGDSVVAWNATTPSYPQLFIPNSSPATYVNDLAIPGTDFQTYAPACLLVRSSWTDSHVPADKRGIQFVLFFTHTNNLNGANYNTPGTPKTAAEQAADIATYAAARKATGRFDKVVIATALSRTDAQANDTYRNAFNAIIANPSWSGRTANGGPIDAVADFAGDAIMGVDASPTVNPTFWADSVHPGSTGHARLEIIFRATINGL